jgi:hypothetical protein
VVPRVSLEHNGKIVTTHVGRGMWIEIVIDGKKHLIQDAIQYHTVFEDCLVVNPELYRSIESGSYLPRDAKLLQDQENKNYYFFAEGKKRLVKDTKKYCFRLSAAEALAHDAIENIPAGGAPLD